MNTLPSEIEDAGTSDLHRLFQILVRRRWWLVAAAVLSTALFVAAALTMTPIYRASAVLVPTANERSGISGALNSTLGQFGGLAALAGVSVGAGDTTTEEALAVLRSRRFIEKFIGDLNLMPVLYSKIWDPAARQWKSEARPPTPARAYKYFSSIRTVIQDKKTGLITLQVEWRDRTQAATWANELAQRLNAEMRGRAIVQADDALKYLERELSTTSTVGTREAINRLIEAQIKQRMLANVTQEYAFRIVDPATAADADDPVRPQKFLLFLLGPIVGLSLGVFAILAFEWLRASSRRDTPA